MNTKYVVKFSKFIVKGTLKGMMIDTQLSFATLEAATDYVGHCIAHVEKPVKAIGNGDYTCHMARIESV